MAVWTGGNASYLFVVAFPALLAHSQILVFTITSDSSNPLKAFGSPLSIPNVAGLRISPDATQLYLLTTRFDDSSNPLQAFGSPLSNPNRRGLRISPGATQLHAAAGSTIDVYQPTGDAANPLHYIASHALGTQVVLGFGVVPGLKYPAALFDEQGQVTIFDAGSMTVGAPSAAFGPQGFKGIAIAPDGSRVYFGTGQSGDAIINALVPSGLSGGTPCP
jgi:hypothetical protein